MMFWISGKFHDAGAVLRGEEQLGDAGLDVGHDLFAVLLPGVLLAQGLQIVFQGFIGIGLQGEGDSRDAAFLYGIHGAVRLSDGFYSVRFSPASTLPAELLLISKCSGRQWFRMPAAEEAFA